MGDLEATLHRTDARLNASRVDRDVKRLAWYPSVDVTEPRVVRYDDRVHRTTSEESALGEAQRAPSLRWGYLYSVDKMVGESPSTPTRCPPLYCVRAYRRGVLRVADSVDVATCSAYMRPTGRAAIPTPTNPAARMGR